MATEKTDKKNGNLSLHPLKFGEAVKGLLEVSPEPKKAKNPKIPQKKA